MNLTRNPRQSPRLLTRHYMRVLATLIAVASVLIGITVNVTAAQANEVDPWSLSFRMATGSALTLDSGTESHSDEIVVDDFKPATSSRYSTVIRWHAQNLWTGKIQSTWRIVEDGVPTGIYILVRHEESDSNYFHGDSCELYDPSGPLDPETAPYSCEFNSGLTYRDAIVHLNPVVRSSVDGSLQTEGALGLDQGHQASQSKHFRVNGSLFQTGQPTAAVTPGQATSWKAELRNGEDGPDEGTRTDFSYQILDAGQPTQYYAKGFMHIYKSGVHYNRDYECHIYSHDPDNGGTVTEYSPYNCVYNATDTGYFNSHLAVDFTVTTR